MPARTEHTAPTDRASGSWSESPPSLSTEVSTASHRLRSLAVLSGSLTDALSPQEAASLVEQQALTALGASYAVVMTLGEFPPVIASSDTAERVAPTTLNLVYSIGADAELISDLEQLPLEASVPLAEVARLGQSIFMPSEQEMLAFAGWGAAMTGAGFCSAAVVPVWANGELRGVLGLAWSVPRPFDEDERAFVITLGVMCAQAIMRAHLRQAERIAREAAEQANRSKTHFLAMVSHELRTPMTAVMGYTDLLTDEIVGPITGLQRDHLGRVRASGHHLLGLIEDLLSYARVEAGGIDVHAERVVLADIIEESLVLVRPMAEKKGLRIHVKQEVMAIELHTDSRKLRQILVNLIANAVKFSEAGDVIVMIRLAGLDASTSVFIEITDHGRGISRGDRSHLFEAYWREGSDRVPATVGSGLGLSVARLLARLLGGDVTLGDSEPGVGSTFIVALPTSYHGSQHHGDVGPEPTSHQEGERAQDRRFFFRLQPHAFLEVPLEAWLASEHAYRGQYLDNGEHIGRRRVRLFHPEDDSRGVVMFADQLDVETHSW
jgi:signal transduction histidine kinase